MHSVFLEYAVGSGVRQKRCSTRNKKYLAFSPEPTCGIPNPGNQVSYSNLREISKQHEKPIVFKRRERFITRHLPTNATYTNALQRRCSGGSVATRRFRQGKEGAARRKNKNDSHVTCPEPSGPAAQTHPPRPPQILCCLPAAALL